MEGILIPQNIFIGDTAEFMFPADALANADLSGLKRGYFQIAKIIQNESMSVTAVQIKMREKKEYISIVFIPWETGNISFPSLKAAGLNVSLPTVPVSSILEMSKTEILQPPRPPIIIPGTTYLLYMAGFITALFVFAGIIIVHSIKKAFFSYSFSRIQKKRINFLISSLKKMKKKYDVGIRQSTSGESTVFFIKEWLKEFEEILRRYCFSIITESFLQQVKEGSGLTYSEIVLELSGKFQNKNIGAEFQNLFSNLQKMRFGKTDFLSGDFKGRETSLLHKSFNLIKLCEPEIQKMEAARRKENKTTGDSNDKF